MTPHAYTAWVIGGCLALLAPVLALSLMLLGNDYRHDKNRLASEWQQQTGGVTYAPPISNNRPFKTLRLADNLPAINTVIFGSSTMMTITADALPPQLRGYNFAQTGNPLVSVISEARYLVRHAGERIRWLIIPVDWSIGFVFDDVRAPDTDLSPIKVAPPLLPSPAVQFREALSLPRVTTLAGVLGEIIRSDKRRETAQKLFMAAVDEPYRCVDGLLARDYDPTFRRKCVGFRADGSATFADQKKITEATAQSALARAASASSQYALALDRTGGRPGALLLDDLAALLQEARARDIRFVLLMPPLLPGLDARLAGSPHSGDKLRRTKAALGDWAKAQGVGIFDAGPSERFGCAATEFIDAHHAVPSCYRKIMTRLFADRTTTP